MENFTTSEDNISGTEDPMPESVKNLISARMFKEITEKDKKEKRE